MHNIKYHKYIAKSYSIPQNYQTKTLERTASKNVSEQNSPSGSKSEDLKKGQQIVNPPVPRDISRENSGLWIAWTQKGDREVVREAASKGYIELAIKFLTLRKNVCPDIVRDFIKTEVFIWTDELLNRKLISRITNIIKNIGLDPLHELQNIFYVTANSDRREFVGSHLSTKDALPANYKLLWTFLDVILENKVLTHDNSLIEDSIERLDHATDEWKDQTAVKLFIATKDARLIPLIKADILWNTLVRANQVDYLKAWIQLSFSSHAKIIIPESFLLVFKSFPITEHMINDLSDLNLPTNSYEIIVNQLASFGHFIEPEKTNVLKVLSRINSADSLINIDQILGQMRSNLPMTTFMSLLIDYCLQNNLLVVLNTCTSNFDLSLIDKSNQSLHLDFIIEFRKLNSGFDEEKVLNNIFKVSEYLSGGDLKKYLCDKPLILLSLLVLTEDSSVIKVMHEKSLVFRNVELYNCLSNVMDEFPMLSNLYFRNTKGVKCNLKYMDLLEKQLGIDVRKAFAFYFDGGPLPSFNSPGAREGFVYSKKITYLFYLKHCRPSVASKYFYMDQLKQPGHTDQQAKIAAEKKVYKIAIKDFQNSSLVTSCVCFLEMIGVSSHGVQVSIKAANILFESGLDKDNVTSLFLLAEQYPTRIQKLLDENLLKCINFTNMMSSGTEFVRAVKHYDVIVNFSLLYHIPLPDGLLRNLAQHNLWLPFLLFAQIKNYPAEQIKELCSHFKNPSLLEHIVHSVLHDIQIDEINILMKERDSRKYLLSKLGLRMSIDEGSDSRSLLSGSMESNLSNSEFLEIDPSNTKATLLQILIRCHNSADPPRALLQASQLYRNPLLAIFASSYEPDSVITNWLTWLAVSTDLYEAFSNFDLMSSCSQQVTSLLSSCMKSKFPKTLLESCFIFIPENPLTPFIDFLNCLIARDYKIEYLAAKLDKFKSLNSSRRASTLGQTDYELTYLKNKVWLEETALQLLCSALIYNTNSLFDQLRFVESLCLVNIESYFSCQIPKFNQLTVILKTIIHMDVQLSLVDFLNVEKEQEVIESCLNELLKLNMFSEALAIAKCFDIDTDRVLLYKWQNKFQSSKDFTRDLVECNKDFQIHKVSAENAIVFFLEQISVNEFNRCCLLKLSHEWAVTYNLANRFDLERKMILSYIKIDKPININELDDASINKNYTTYKEMLDLLQNIDQLEVSLTPEIMGILDGILIEALDQRDFWLALKLEKMFGCKNSDLDILKLCHELAEGLVMPYQLNEEQQLIIARVREIQRISNRRRSRYKSVSNSSEGSFMELIEEEESKQDYPFQATQGLIHSLIEKLSHGSELAYYVFMKYRISANIEVPYNIVVSNTDPMVMLQVALQDDCPNKLEVVHDFFEVFEWTKEDITNFVCDEFVSAASQYSQSKIDIFTMWDIKVIDQFHLVLSLLRDECSALGYKLYNYATVIHKQQVFSELNFKISEMSLVVELLIAAHNCFTADCNMEGISSILKKCRKVIDHLLEVRSWKLIVRLLTGVGRYTELNFVFDELKENDQFEFLLSKGSKRDERLKLACLEYLKKTCPQDRELYKLVAIHFNLYSDIAALWEREAQGHIKNLLLVSEMMNDNPNQDDPMVFLLLTKSTDTDFLLDKAMNKYFQAAEFHVQGEKLSSAMNAACQAELIALQKSLFKSVQHNQKVPSVLNLTNVKIAKLMSAQLSFHQSNILAQAYNFCPDWQEILFEQAINNNNPAYFDQYAETLGVTDELVQDIVKKFQKLKSIENYQLKNIKYIIEQVESLHLKYLLASELGFSRLANDVINSDKIYYLKDTVYKSGYKGQNAPQYSS